MAKILAVLYPDPVDGYPEDVRPRRRPQDRPLPRRSDRPQSPIDRFQTRPAARQRFRRAGPAQVSRRPGPHVRRDIRQGRPQLGVRARAAGRRHRHLAAVLARVSHQGEARQGQEPEARHHRRHRLRPHRSAGRDGQGHHRRRDHLQQLDQRRRARRHDDPVARAQLSPVLRVGEEGRLEHRRLRRALVRSRRHERRHRGRRAHRPCRAAPIETLRRQAALHRQAPPAGEGREGARAHLSQGRRVHGEGVRRHHDQRAAASRDRGHVQRQADREDEARLVPHQHGARQDRRPRCRRARAGERPAGRLRRRRVVPAAGTEGSPVAHHAASRHDAAHLGLIALRAGTLCGRHARNPRELLRQEAYPHRVPDRRQGQAGRYRRAFLQRRRCDQGSGERVRTFKKSA